MERALTDLTKSLEDKRLGIKELFAFGAAYMMAVGACYLVGYWGSFQINVFEYISFADVVKLAIFPLMPFLVGLLAGVACHQLWYAEKVSTQHKNNHNLQKTNFKVLRRFLIAIILSIVLVSFFSPMLRKMWPPLPSGLIAFFVGMLAIPLSYVDELINIFPNREFRLVSLFLFLFMPPISWAYGSWLAHTVKTGGAELFVDVLRSPLPFESDPNSQVAYLGLLGDLYVLRESQSGKIVFLKKGGESPLFLVPKHLGNTSAIRLSN